MISSGGAFCAWMLAGKLKKLKQMRVRKLIADADFIFNRFGRSILKGQTPLIIKKDKMLMPMHDLYKFENGSDREKKRMK
tara:strand:+ start:240 stop:479 length:240 start_codon:yes stop_codon:yes gene_type:complete